VAYEELSLSMGLMDTTDEDDRRQEANPVAMADLDGDGLDDLILGVRTSGIWVQMNRGDHFESTQISEVQEVVGLALGDVDGNGTLDLWAGGYFPTLLLFLGDGMGGFEDVSASSGMSGFATRPMKKDATFGDFDGDGDLDLFVNQATDAQNPQEDTRDKLLRNRGDGTFEDVSHWLADALREGLGWSSVWTDIDLDGDLDLFTANADQAKNGPSRLLRNDGPGPDDTWLFTDLTESCFCTDNNNPMGASAGDWNNDGLFDLFLTNTGSNQLLQNAGNGTYVDMSQVTGGMELDSEKHMSFGSAWFDYDNDGWQDVFFSSGPLGNAQGQAHLAEQADQLLRNNGSHFQDVAPELGLDATGAGRGVSVGMLNDDGFLDIAVLNLGTPSFLYQAQCTAARALVVDLDGTPPNTFGMGARIVVETDNGTLHREVSSKPGWGGAMHPRAHFGLGDRRIQSVTVHWLNGEAQEVQVHPLMDGRIRVAQE
jgi:hypothetical protein